MTSHQKTGRGVTAFETIGWMMGDGLTDPTGAFCLRQRRMLQPRFHRRYIDHYAGAMTEISSRKARQWQDGARDDIEQEMRDLTLQLVAKALFDIETSDVVRRVGRSFAESEGYMYLRLTQPPLYTGSVKRRDKSMATSQVANAGYCLSFGFGHHCKEEAQQKALECLGA